MQNAGLDEGQAGVKVSRTNINDLRYVDDTILMVESEKKLKRPQIHTLESNER